MMDQDELQRKIEDILAEIAALAPREKVRRRMSVLVWRIHAPVLDLELGGERASSVLLLAVLTCLVQGKMPLFGPSGTGKSTLVESCVQLLFGDPFATLQAATIHGHTELTLVDLERQEIPSPARFAYINALDKLHPMDQDCAGMTLRNQGLVTATV